jgi:hypothetical protein
VRLAVATVMLLATATFVSPARATAGNTISGAEFAQQALSRGLALNGTTVTSDVNLSGTTITHPLSCQSCVFIGKLIANGTTFNQIVDLRGSTLQGAAFFSDSTFNGPALFGSPSATAPVTTFFGPADFSLATFAEVATFEGTTLKQADFTLARFDSGVSFADGISNGADEFTRTVFQDAVDFSDHNFSGTVDFGGAAFAAPVDFSNATFNGSASFQRARFTKGALFLVATFPKTKGAYDSFNEVQSAGDLNFSYAEFDREADFDDVTASGTISFHGAKLAAPKNMHFTDVTAAAFDMSVGPATRAVDPEDLPTVLGLIESGAKTRGDLGVANDAHYEHQVLGSRKDSWPVHVLDYVFYRTFAGYLVRPLNPLFTLLALAALVTAFQVVRPAWKQRAPVEGRLRRRVRLWSGRTRRIVPRLGGAYLQTLTLVGPGRASAADERAARRIEIFLYRLLFVCALIGFANSNPTLRQMFDAIR